jgi:hypothetical protein
MAAPTREGKWWRGVSMIGDGVNRRWTQKRARPAADRTDSLRGVPSVNVGNFCKLERGFVDTPSFPRSGDTEASPAHCVRGIRTNRGLRAGGHVAGPQRPNGAVGAR